MYAIYIYISIYIYAYIYMPYAYIGVVWGFNVGIYSSPMECMGLGGGDREGVLGRSYSSNILGTASLEVLSPIEVAQCDLRSFSLRQTYHEKKLRKTAAVYPARDDSPSNTHLGISISCFDTVDDGVYHPDCFP